MTPHDILKYSCFNALLSHHQRCCVLQQMRTKRGPRYTGSKRPWNTRPYTRCLYQIPPTMVYIVILQWFVVCYEKYVMRIHPSNWDRSNRPQTHIRHIIEVSGHIRQIVARKISWNLWIYCYKLNSAIVTIQINTPMFLAHCFRTLIDTASVYISISLLLKIFEALSVCIHSNTHTCVYLKIDLLTVLCLTHKMGVNISNQYWKRRNCLPWSEYHKSRIISQIFAFKMLYLVNLF